MTRHEIPQVETCEELKKYPDEYQQAVHKLVISHAINELHGARVYDEPAVALAPTPYAKWLTCRVAMEEYGHHVRFFELGRELGSLVNEAADWTPETLAEAIEAGDFADNYSALTTDLETFNTDPIV